MTQISFAMFRERNTVCPPLTNKDNDSTDIKIR